MGDGVWSGMRTILLVEDNPGDVAQLQRAVRLAGLAVRLEVVGDGAEAPAAPAS